MFKRGLWGTVLVLLLSSSVLAASIPTFSIPVMLEDTPIGAHDWTPDATVDPQGTIHSVWADERYGDGDGLAIMHAFSNDHGDSWSENNLVAHTPEAFLGDPRIINTCGYILVLWTDHTNGGMYTAFSEDGGLTWNNPVTVSSEGGAYSNLVKVRKSRAVAVWSEDTGIFVARSQDGGRSWKRPRLVVEDPSAMAPSAAFKKGLLHLAWVAETSEGKNGIFYAYSDNLGRTWSPKEQVNQETEANLIWGTSIAVGKVRGFGKNPQVFVGWHDDRTGDLEPYVGWRNEGSWENMVIETNPETRDGIPELTISRRILFSTWTNNEFSEEAYLRISALGRRKWETTVHVGQLGERQKTLIVGNNIVVVFSEYTSNGKMIFSSRASVE